MVSTGSSEQIFIENQPFRNPWVRLLVVLACGGLVINFGYGFIRQIVFGRAWGERAMPDMWLVVLTAVVTALAAALIWLAFRLSLTVTVGKRAVKIRMFPFINKTIPLDSIIQAEAVTYNPLKDYGGWGVKWGGPKKGWAYNISGNRGVALTLRSGKKLLVGSQRSEELAAAIWGGGLVREPKK